MAEASISVDQDQFSCPVCLDLLEDPVTVPCGHSFCMVCINGCWDQEDQRGVYSCPQCRETFTPRPVLRRSYFIAEILEKLKKTEVRAAPPAGSGDVECDFCTGRKRKAAKSCLTCLVSFCEGHLKPHYEGAAWKKHKLVTASARLQEKICSQHDKLMEIYCRTDRSSICYLCAKYEHVGHDTVSAAAERTQKQRELEEMQREVQQRIQEKQKKLQELEQAVNTLKSFQSLSVSSGSEDSSSISDHHHLSFDGVRSALSDLKERLEEFCREEFRKIPPQAAAAPLLLSEPKSREDFLQYFCQLTLNPNTANRHLILSESNRVVKWSHVVQSYSDHPERFDCRSQVLSVERLSGRCYWEVERSGPVKISVSYKEIRRKGEGDECVFGRNDQSCSLYCSSSFLSFWYNNIKTALPGDASSTIGVYVDHSAGILSFYSVSDTMTLLHTVHSTFTKPVYAGFWVSGGSSVRLCDKK
ncbi:E3 ubiquitin/ISG15 ligase TRIM25-like isoform X2 [Colossoma macropomum]|uniref:E3 ubiquitin/ISG15 ligase TRIM25-like isoform X2 n=1 Tax=Colossoma macropomum TaxID=42526 RepID=UPI0018646674|nr:E3 ubiquitin/ISG15 ligase TRIM25-like isoform X2 [Colossoma macropomum]